MEKGDPKEETRGIRKHTNASEETTDHRTTLSLHVFAGGSKKGLSPEFSAVKKQTRPTATERQRFLPFPFFLSDVADPREGLCSFIGEKQDYPGCLSSNRGDGGPCLGESVDSLFPSSIDTFSVFVPRVLGESGGNSRAPKAIRNLLSALPWTARWLLRSFPSFEPGKTFETFHGTGSPPRL